MRIAKSAQVRTSNVSLLIVKKSVNLCKKKEGGEKEANSATCGILFKQIDDLLLEYSGGFVDLSVLNDSGSGRPDCPAGVICTACCFKPYFGNLGNLCTQGMITVSNLEIMVR
jgi:hypothetical protein